MKKLLFAMLLLFSIKSYAQVTTPMDIYSGTKKLNKRTKKIQTPLSFSPNE
ncbi:MAG: hypothetical protein V4594_08380 [Bacteroidota bacterium]